jgi:hypothetical protein
LNFSLVNQTGWTGFSGYKQDRINSIFRMYSLVNQTGWTGFSGYKSCAHFAGHVKNVMLNPVLNGVKEQ